MSPKIETNCILYVTLTNAHALLRYFWASNIVKVMPNYQDNYFPPHLINMLLVYLACYVQLATLQYTATLQAAISTNTLLTVAMTQ